MFFLSTSLFRALEGWEIPSLSEGLASLACIAAVQFPSSSKML
jgi:hypothetical protein